MKLRNLKKRRAQRTRAKNPISAVKSNPREDPRRVALEARQRVLGVSPADAAQPEAGTVLGRMRLAGDITESMYEAGKRYLELYLAYLKALKAPVGLAKGSGSASDGEASDDYIEWAIRAEANYRVMKAALDDSRGHAPNFVEAVAVHDMDPGWGYFYLAGQLGFLARKMGIDRAVAA